MKGPERVLWLVLCHYWLYMAICAPIVVVLGLSDLFAPVVVAGGVLLCSVMAYWWITGIAVMIWRVLLMLFTRR